MIKTVKIPRIAEHNGYPGNIIQVQLEWKCPICSKERGEIHDTISYDGSRRLAVDGWDNPCGHVDKYSAIIEETSRNKLNIITEDMPNTPIPIKVIATIILSVFIYSLAAVYFFHTSIMICGLSFILTTITTAAFIQIIIQDMKRYETTPDGIWITIVISLFIWGSILQALHL